MGEASGLVEDGTSMSDYDPGEWQGMLSKMLQEQ